MKTSPFSLRGLCRSLLLGLALHGTAADAVRDRPHSHGDSTQEGFVIPFEYDPPLTPILVIQVRINGGRPLPFIVDTGLNTTMVIDTQTAGQLKLHATGKPTKLVPGNLDLFKLPLKSVSILGTAHLDVDLDLDAAYEMNLAAFRKTIGRPQIAGILGLTALGGNPFQLDFGAKTMTVFAEMPSPQSGPGTTILHMMERDDGYFLNVETPEGGSADLLVDTGSTTTNLPLPIASRLHPQARLTHLWLSADGAFHVADKLLLADLHIGDLKEPSVAVGSIPAVDVPQIGLDILSRFLVTLDFRNRLMVLTRPADYARRMRLNGWTGIYLAKRQGAYIIERIVPGSPAEKAGVRHGDHMISVDGHRLAPLPILVAQSLLNGFAGSQARLLLEGRRDPRTLTRQGEFDDPDRVNLGLTMQKAPHGPLTVLEVDKTSVAAAHGVRVGDMILTWNGQPTAQMTPEQFAVQIRTHRIRMSVQRHGMHTPIPVEFGTR